MTFTTAALVLTNLVYLAGAVVVATLVSGLYVLRHRKPTSLESGIESFSRELRALAPERGPVDGRADGSGRPGGAAVTMPPPGPSVASTARLRAGVDTARQGPPPTARGSGRGPAAHDPGAPRAGRHADGEDAGRSGGSPG